MSMPYRSSSSSLASFDDSDQTRTENLLSIITESLTEQRQKVDGFPVIRQDSDQFSQEHSFEHTQSSHTELFSFEESSRKEPLSGSEERIASRTSLSPVPEDHGFGFSEPLTPPSPRRRTPPYPPQRRSKSLFERFTTASLISSYVERSMMSTTRHRPVVPLPQRAGLTLPVAKRGAAYAPPTRCT
eukprot:gnl/Chilomastix_cuspidata/946.p1 GENE.gnl/Chilomastix_cuspidata/946~~gnl/Chilomastix_cuspidata/946.p1  ORF type:complete len:193 (+),score=7.54 gnl/Chilomastix_cuspidata/946:22-579(+)